MASPKPPRRFLLLTCPRTASNLLQKIISVQEQPDLVSRTNGGYFFLALQFLSNKLGTGKRNVEHWTNDEKSEVRQLYRKCIDELEEHVQSANAQGKNVFVKEHCFLMADPTAHSKFLFGEESVKESPWVFQGAAMANGESNDRSDKSPLNETVLSDEFLKTFFPTFLIRHPALSFPSQVRALIDIFGKEWLLSEKIASSVSLSLRWTRNLYDFYSRNLNPEEAAVDGDWNLTWPIVIDGDDIMTDPAVIFRFTEAMGLDVSKVKYEWEPIDGGERVPFQDDRAKRFLSTLWASNGIVKGKTSNGVSVEEETEKWKSEFGDELALWIAKLVMDAMPDYEYLKARRLRARPE